MNNNKKKKMKKIEKLWKKIDKTLYPYFTHYDQSDYDIEYHKNEILPSRNTLFVCPKITLEKLCFVNVTRLLYMSMDSPSLPHYFPSLFYIFYISDILWEN